MPPRVRLSRQTVVETAEMLVDRDGWQHLTMTELANQLDVRVPSLYNHVGSLDDVLTELQVRAHHQLGMRNQRAAVGTVGPDAVRAIARAFQAWATEHPGMCDLAMTSAIDRDRVVEASEPSGAALGAVIMSFGVVDLRPELFLSVVAALYGVIALDRTQLFGPSLDVQEAYDRAVELIITMLENESASERAAAPPADARA